MGASTDIALPSAKRVAEIAKLHADIDALQACGDCDTNPMIVDLIQQKRTELSTSHMHMGDTMAAEDLSDTTATERKVATKYTSEMKSCCENKNTEKGTNSALEKNRSNVSELKGGDEVATRIQPASKRRSNR